MLRIFLILTALLMSISANAYTCSGLVTGISIEASTGDLLVESIGPLKWPRLCRVDNEVRGISAEACKVVYSTLLTAQTSNKPVTLWFNDDKDCSVDSHTPWRTLTGWYFGPMLGN